MSHLSDEQKKSYAFDADCTGRRNEMEADKDKTLDRLRSELIKDVDVMDEFEVEKIEGIIAEIENIEGIQDNFNMLDAFNNFDTNILQKAIHQDAILSSIKGKSDKQLTKANQRSNIRRKLSKISSIAASILIIFVVSNVVTIVFADFNIFKPLIDWTSEVFTIKTKNETENPIILENGNKMYSDFKFVRRDYGESLSLPSYTPKGYKIDNIIVMENGKSELSEATIRYVSEKNEDFILISIVYISGNSSNESHSVNIEKDDSDVKEFSVDGIDCYVFENTNWNIGVWNDGNYSYSVFAALPLEEIEKIVRSSIQR